MHEDPTTKALAKERCNFGSLIIWSSTEDVYKIDPKKGFDKML